MKKHNQKGFTLIEVILVLAIGGLIFMMAFLAFSQVQRNRRDTQRRADAAFLLGELENYASDYNGNLPANSASSDNCSTTTTGSFGEFLNGYICKSGGFEGPSGPYTIIDSDNGVMSPSTAADRVMFTKDRSCSGAEATGTYRVQIGLESGAVCREAD